LDALFVNPIDQPQGGFGSAENHGWLWLQNGEALAFPPLAKLALAHQIFDQLQTGVS